MQLNDLCLGLIENTTILFANKGAISVLNHRLIILISTTHHNDDNDIKDLQYQQITLSNYYLRPNGVR